MKVFSLFSGVGGFELGMPKDWEIVGFSEIDKYASQVLKYHYPNTTNYGDCSKINYREVPDFDLLTGGSPCQDFSIAGKRAGIVGSRSGLVWEYIRCLQEKQPRYFIWENVKGVMSSKGGWDFANILIAFSESGYALWWQVLNAKDFGVPQNRERVFVIGFSNGSPKEVFFKPKDSGQIEVLGTTKGKENTRDYKQPPQILVKNKGESQHYRLYDENGLAPTLQSQSGMSSQKHPFVIQKQGNNIKNEKYVRKDLVGSLKSSNQSNPRSGGTSLIGQIKVRKLMPIECERLMGWEDDWTKFGIDEKGNKVEISDSQRYKMCGNGVVSNVVREVINNLIS